MAINLDRRIFAQGGRTGLQQVDARPLVDAGNRFAQFGKDVQNLGTAVGEYRVRQKEVADDLGFGELKNDFDAQQLLDQSKFDKLKANPSMLIKYDNSSGGQSSALTSSAFTHSINNESRLTKTAKFKNLSQANQAKFLAYTGNQTNITEAKAKLETTKLLVAASQRADVDSLANILSLGARPGSSESIVDANIKTLKDDVVRKQKRGEYQPGQADAFLKQIDKKVANMKFGRDRANANVSGELDDLTKIDEKLKRGEYGIPGEDLGKTRIILWNDFNSAHAAKAARSSAESKLKVDSRAQELAKDIREDEVSREILVDRVNQFAKGAGRGRKTLTDKLYKQIADLDTPASESPNSENQVIKNQITAIDLTDSDAKVQLEMMLEVVDAMTNSEVDSFTMKHSTDRLAQIKLAITGLDDADAKAFNVQKKTFKDLIMIKTKPKGGFLAGLTDSEANLRIFALEYYDNLLERGFEPSDAWNNINEIIEQSKDGVGSKKVNTSELNDQLGFDVSEMKRMTKKFKADPSSLTAEEKNIVLLMRSANKANKTFGRIN